MHKASFKSIVEDLSSENREILANHWSNMALSEHASIGSFSRFSLQLLAIGAPPNFLDAAHAAARDEIRHAQMCFAIASVYAGEDLRPGPLSLDGDILGDTSLESIVTSTITEGCIGETLSAAELNTALTLTKVPRIKTTLQTIINEESHHSRLAWEVVRWALKENPSIRTIVKDAFSPVLNDVHNPCPKEDPAFNILSEHGCISSAKRWFAHRNVCKDIIVPAARFLIDNG